MKKHLTFKQKILVAGTLFGMFFGAGNLIFPVHLGQLAGRNVIPAMIGFIITAVGIPIMGVAAIGNTHSDGLQQLSNKVGKGYGYVFSCLLYLTIGPGFAIPRCATTSFTVGVAPMLGAGASESIALLIFSVIFFAIVLLHGLLYVADPTIESRGDAPLSLTITFVLLLALSLILAGASSKPNQYLQIICLFGNVLFVFLFLGLIAVSFLSVTHGDFSFAAIVVLALARVFDGLLLVALAVNSFSGNSGPVRSFSLYLLILYWLPTAFSYVLLPVLTTNFAFDTSAILGSASLAIAAVLVLAIVVIFSFFMVKAGPRESKEDGNTNAENRRTACAFLARQFGLTQREEEVLYYVSLGYSSKIAGEKLFVAPGTVQSHTKRIYTKLGVHSKQQLISLVDESESK